ncbi:MAG: pyridoxal-dependent decarboxylase, partial [Planctomycetia bacterium]|nr:pyridoxal-dependent decarboxylase [Planctomycetia bacterium]
ERYFSRNPDYWPIFRDPGLSHILHYTKEPRTNLEQLENYPDQEKLLDRINTDSDIPESCRFPDSKSIDPLLLFAGSLSKQWNNPASVENVVTMPSDPALYGSMLAMLVNPNLVCSEYSIMANKLEKLVIRRIAKLAGYDPDCAGGLFTQGGTFCNLYGYLFGLRKVIPESESLGFDSINNYRFICSQGGHYSNYTTLSVMGANIAEKNIRIKLDSANRMDLADLEEQLSACYLLGCKVPTIMLTMGTTDSFGIDRVKPVYDLVDRLHKKFYAKLPKLNANSGSGEDRRLVKPHIHVDSAIGWAILFFLDYDFKNNPLFINARTLENLSQYVDLFKELKYADSFSVDFHKWGYVPYTSSLVMVKDDSSFRALEHDPEYYSYFDRSEMVHTHLQSTVEASRGGAGIFGAYSALQYLGIEGFQMLIAHTLQNSAYFRHEIENAPGAALLTQYNYGPSVTFRLFDPDRIPDAKKEWDFESNEYVRTMGQSRIKSNSDYHRSVFERRGKQHLYTSWIEFAAHTKYDEEGKFIRVPGEKAVFFNPLTSYQDIDAFIRILHGNE